MGLDLLGNCKYYLFHQGSVPIQKFPDQNLLVLLLNNQNRDSRTKQLAYSAIKNNLPNLSQPNQTTKSNTTKKKRPAPQIRSQICRIKKNFLSQLSDQKRQKSSQA